MMSSRHFWLYVGILNVFLSTTFFSQVSEAKEIKARECSAKLEAQWTAFWVLCNDPFSGFLREPMSHSSSLVGNQDTAGRSFAEAADYYLLHKGKTVGIL